jgi:hypothetical protein
MPAIRRIQSIPRCVPSSVRISICGCSNPSGRLPEVIWLMHWKTPFPGRAAAIALAISTSSSSEAKKPGARSPVMPVLPAAPAERWFCPGRKPPF